MREVYNLLLIYKSERERIGEKEKEGEKVRERTTITFDNKYHFSNDFQILNFPSICKLFFIFRLTCMIFSIPIVSKTNETCRRVYAIMINKLDFQKYTLLHKL